MPRFACRALHSDTLLPFAQYLLPNAAAGGPDLVLLGLTIGPYAAGAACAHIAADGEAVLASLFVDPSVRGQGGGSLLLDETIAVCRARGARTLSARYTLAGDALNAMNALLQARGARPVFCAPTFCIDMTDLRDVPLTRAALSPDFRPASVIRPLSQLSQAQLDALAALPHIPTFVQWAHHRDRADPTLSLAWIADGTPHAFALASETADGGFALLSIASAPSAPPVAALALVRALLSRCRYRCGGDYRLYVSAVTPKAVQLIDLLTRGRYTAYAEYTARFTLSPEHR